MLCALRRNNYCVAVDLENKVRPGRVVCHKKHKDLMRRLISKWLVKIGTVYYI